MKNFLLVLAMLLLAGATIGCNTDDLSNSRGEGLVDNAEQRRNRIDMIWDINDRIVQDDIDNFWLIDRNCRLTEWNLFVGN